ncbi:helix-turn-helix transcriptional regulator [Spiractinospora alimapuensis]|uniref:TetR/AcrR family transcriptional regulator n=1 Tax=Spiractinospora alimapuensis TaxID=2820884 RepID=UPI002ED1D969|nr:helix-turn-helix transcriptional regulator [Spiractinospora alimapuensis]
MSEPTASDLTARARLRLAALRLFAERGFAGTTTRAIATEAGVSHALLRHHFGSKEGLRRAVDDDVLDAFDTVVSRFDAPNTEDDALAVFAQASAQLFGADELRRNYLRRSLIEGSPASGELFLRLLEGTRRSLALIRSDGGQRVETGLEGDPDRYWAPFQVLFLILGPMLLEPVLGEALPRPVFDSDVLRTRSSANQRLLLRGLPAMPGQAGRTPTKDHPTSS